LSRNTFEWLAAVRFDANDGTRRIWIIPRDVAIALSGLRPEGEYRLSYTKPGLQAFENNFTLCPKGITSPPCPAAANFEDRETIGDLAANRNPL
jgi:hypothetical protein